MFENISTIQSIVSMVGIGGLFFVAWYFTQRWSSKTMEKVIDKHAEQYQFALTQNQEQFDKALRQNQEQFNKSLEQNATTNERLFRVIQDNAEYHRVLTGVLKEAEINIKAIKKIVEKENKD